MIAGVFLVDHTIGPETLPPFGLGAIASFSSFLAYLKLVVGSWQRPHADDMENLINELAGIPLAGFVAFLLVTGAPFVVRLAHPTVP